MSGSSPCRKIYKKGVNVINYKINYFINYTAYNLRPTCVEFVSFLPQVKELNLALCKEMSASVLWRMKETLISIVWGEMFSLIFANFFKIYDKAQKETKDISLNKVYFLRYSRKRDKKEFSL